MADGVGATTHRMGEWQLARQPRHYSAIDGNTSACNPGLGGTVFTASPNFTLNAINIATFAAPGETPSVALDEIRIGRSWSSIVVNKPSGPSHTVPRQF